MFGAFPFGVPFFGQGVPGIVPETVYRITRPYIVVPNEDRRVRVGAESRRATVRGDGRAVTVAQE